MKLRPHGPGMMSDAISSRWGFDGTESDAVMGLHKKHASLGVRCTFAVNTFYPEVSSGYFENRALYELIDSASRELGVLPVLGEDLWRATNEIKPLATEFVVPIQGRGQLIVDEDYALLRNDGSQVGMLLVWRFHAGGGGKYYSDNVIFDFVLPLPLMDRLADSVERKCSEAHVRFTRFPPVGTTEK